MTRDEVEALAAGGEGPCLEFKRSTGTLEAAFETLCAFLNGEGGRVLVGVGDDRGVTGQQVADKTLQQVAHYRSQLDPPARVTTTRVPVAAGREVLVLSVEADPAGGPYTFAGRAYERVENTTRPMPRARLAERFVSRAHAHRRWETEPADELDLADLDAQAILAVPRAAHAKGRLEEPVDEEPAAILDRLGLRSGSRLLRAAVVLFARSTFPAYSQCLLQMARFRGRDKTEFLDQAPLLHSGAFASLQEAEVFCRRHIPVAGKVPADSFRRQDTPLIPPEALREILINALIHRDYAMAGTGIQLAIFDDRLEVWSPGSLPGGLTPEDLLRKHPSIRRNELVAGVFHRVGLIERWGRGTNRVARLCREAGLPPPEFRQVAGFVVVTFRASIGTTAAPPAPFTPAKLRAARRGKGWHQARLAEELGISQSLVSRWERAVEAIPDDRQEELWKLLGKE